MRFGINASAYSPLDSQPDHLAGISASSESETSRSTEHTPSTSAGTSPVEQLQTVEPEPQDTSYDSKLAKPLRVPRLSAFFQSVRLSVLSFLKRTPPRMRRLGAMTVCVLLLLLTFLHYHTKTVVRPAWRYFPDPKDVDAKDVLRFVSMSPARLALLNLDQTLVPLSVSKDETNAYDPRLPVALYLRQITSHIVAHEGRLDPDFKLRFSWKDWADFDRRLLPSTAYLSRSDKFPLQSCQQFMAETGFGAKQSCMDLTPSEIKRLANPLYPHFKITGPADASIARDARLLVAATYLYHSFDAPDRLLFVEGEKNRVLAVRTEDSKDKESLLEELQFDYLGEDRKAKSGAKYISLKDQVSKLDELLDAVSASEEPAELQYLDQFKVIRTADERENAPVQLERRLFDWTKDTGKFKQDIERYLESLNADCERVPDSPRCNHDKAIDYKFYHRVLESIDEHSDNLFPKHFHEAGYTAIGRDNGAHFDWRFLVSRQLFEYESTSGLHRLMRSWLRTTRVLGIDTWIAHGSLLGYYFNGLTLSWDFDHDVHVTQESLTRLAGDYSNSLVVDISAGTPDQPELSDQGMGLFYLDVGTSFYFREKGNGNNAIDARFIDVNTGLFIDITALAATRTRPQQTAMGKNLGKEHRKFLDQNKLTEDDYLKFLADRNNHHYTLDELTPLIPALFEGEKCMIPQKTTRILSREYMRYKSNWNFENHTWRTRYRSWIPDWTCSRNDLEGNSCSGNAKVRLDEKLQKEYIDLHMPMRERLDTAENVIGIPPEDIHAYGKVLRPDAALMRIAHSRS